jgi:integrase
MSTNTSFVLTRFANRNGTPSWRISGWLHGVRIRRNFKSREDAAAQKSVLEIQAAQEAAGMRRTSTFLAETQLREAEDAFRRLTGNSRSLLFYLDYALNNFRDLQLQKPLNEAVDEYLSSKQRESERSLLSPQQLRSIKNELNVLRTHFPAGPLCELTPPKLIAYLGRGDPALKTFNNRRALVSTFCKFALQQDWLATNPVEKIPHHRISHRRGSAATISAAHAKELMAFLETYENGAMVPHFAVCLFAGIRPSPRDGEIAKLRPEHIRMDTGVILIEPEVSKVRMKRQVTIQPNLARWLEAYPFKPTKPSYTEYHREKIAKRFALTHDVMRHTFISMFVAKFRSMGEAALQAGNSESIIRKHYLDLKNPDEAEQFFGILPMNHCDGASRGHVAALQDGRETRGPVAA